MDALASARIMATAARLLKAGGWALVTLKLPQRHVEETVVEALEMLRKTYDGIGARQLFHNRNEITVVLSLAGGQFDWYVAVLYSIDSQVHQRRIT